MKPIPSVFCFSFSLSFITQQSLPPWRDRECFSRSSLMSEEVRKDDSDYIKSFSEKYLSSLNALSDPSFKRARRCLTPLIGQALLVSTYTSSNGLISFTFGPTELANTPLESWESALSNATNRGKFASVLLSLTEPSLGEKKPCIASLLQCL